MNSNKDWDLFLDWHFNNWKLYNAADEDVDFSKELYKRVYSHNHTSYVRDSEFYAWKAGAQSRQEEVLRLQAEAAELQKRVNKTDSLIMSFGDDIDVPLRNALIDAAWIYADAMYAEYEKRSPPVKSLADIAKEIQGVDMDDTFVEKEGQHFNDVMASLENHECNFVYGRVCSCGKIKEEWQPDWSAAPDAKYWAIDSSGFADWFSDKPELDEESFVGNRLRSALQYSYQGNWRDSLRKRPK